MSLLAAGASLLGNVAGAVYGKHTSDEQQKRAQEFTKWQMENAHQSEVADLKAAGLNPVLSAGGSGASAGVGGHTSTSSPAWGSDAVNAGITASTMRANVGNIKSDTDLKKAMENTETAKQANVNADTILKGKQAGLTNQQIKTMTETGTYGGMPNTSTTDSWKIGPFSRTRTDSGPANRNDPNTQTERNKIKKAQQDALNEISKKTGRREWKVY